MSHNPYAPPQARVVVRAGSSDASHVWRENANVVLLPDADLPPRCVKCNAAAEQPARPRTLYWHTPWLYLVVLISPLIYLIVALIARKSVKLHPGLCAEHRVARRNVLLGSWSVALAGIGLIVLGIEQSSGPLGLGGAALMLGGMIFGVAKGRLVYAVRIDAQRIELRGCGEAFLASLPRRR